MAELGLEPVVMIGGSFLLKELMKCVNSCFSLGYVAVRNNPQISVAYNSKFLFLVL